jgi:anti-sigma-K factor RskA
MNGTPHDPTRLSPQALEALEETLAAYALGALPQPEAEAVTRHLAGCAACRTVTADLTDTVGLLAAAPVPVEPSPDLRHRILATAQAEQQSGVPPDSPTVPTAPPAPVPFPGPAAPPGRPTTARRAATWFPWLAAAAALLVSLGVGVWNAQLQNELRQQAAVLDLYESARQTWALAGTAEAPAAHGLVAVPPGGGRPVVVLQDLPNQPSSRTYQVWIIRDGQPVSAAVLRPGQEGQQRVELQQDLAGVQTVAVSVEPAGGSLSPTGPIVLAGNL